jgi:Protein of unknown function (DUF1579)
MINNLFAFALFALTISSAALAQEQTPPPDGPQHTFQDDLLDKMTGQWKLTGTIRGHSAEHVVDAQWTLNHQFLQVHEKDTAAPKGPGPSYETNVMIGYDNASERYIAHWLDVYGGRFSETLGYGTRSGDQIEFVFEYPDGPFRTTFRWMADEKQWQWKMRTKNSAGQWVDFANLTLTPAGTP